MRERVLVFLLARYADSMARISPPESPPPPESPVPASPPSASALPESPLPSFTGHSESVSPAQIRLEIERRGHLLYAPPVPPAPGHTRLRSRATLGRFLREIGDANAGSR